MLFSFVRAIMLFGMGVHLTTEEESLLEDIIRPAYAASGLSNDYFSFDREWSERNATRKDSVASEPMKNAVWLCMGWFNLSALEAKEMVKRETIKYEDEFITRRRAFEDANPAHSDNIRKCLDGVAQMVIGNVAWSLQCPRYRPELRYNPNAAVENDFLHSRTTKLQEIAAACANHIPQRYARHAATGEYGVVAAPPATKKQLRKSLDAIAGSMLQEAVSSKLLADVVTAPFDWCASLPSKNVRSSLIDAFSIWFPVSRSTKDRIQTVGYLLHNASLLLDDIGDGSHLRRGQPTAHKIFGVPETINSANLAILEAMEKVSELPAPSFTVCATEMRKLFIGQGHDLLWARQHKCPSEAEYFEMIDGKTGGLFQLLIGLLMCNSTTKGSSAQARVHKLLKSLGRLFQVRDDYQNLVCPAYASQKGFCEDLDEGKFSYPVVCALGQTEKDVSMLRNILANPREGGYLSDELKRLALKQLVSSHSLEKSRMTITRLHAEVEKTITEVEDMLQTPNWILRLLVKKLGVEDIDSQL
jgi:geranylgeranyl pyrophosphate synthase